MKTGKLIIYTFLIFICCTIFGSCYHNLQPSEINIEKAGSNFVISSASKCHAIDGSVIVYMNGFSVRSNIITGLGERYYFNRNEKETNVESFPLDSIVAITTYDDYTGSRLIANGSLSFMGTILSGLSIYCLACPKCCFGSCPTVYTINNDLYSLETELFSSSISRMLEDDDLDKLKQKIPDDGIYEIKITNEALETHYINKFNLILAEHPLGTEVFPNIERGLTIMSNPVSVESAVNSDGIDIQSELSFKDTISYRSGMEMINELKWGPKYDWLEITSTVPENSGKAKLLLRYRNTLLSTILFYDVVLGSQGINAVKWIDKMNNDPGYAGDFKMIYDNFSGMQFEIFENRDWKFFGKFPDAGPICWKEVAAEIPVSSKKELKFRLKFIPDNFMIDYVGIEYGSIDDNNIRTETIIPVEIKNNSNNPDANALSSFEKSDKKYLVTNPGDSYNLIYNINNRTDVEQTVLISSGGYYNEWIRGTWIKNDSTSQRFDLYNVNRNLKILAESWETNKALIESEFFNTRIPVKEK